MSRRPSPCLSVDFLPQSAGTALLDDHLLFLALSKACSGCLLSYSMFNVLEWLSTSIVLKSVVFQTIHSYFVSCPIQHSYIPVDAVSKTPSHSCA